MALTAMLNPKEGTDYMAPSLKDRISETKKVAGSYEKLADALGNIVTGVTLFNWAEKGKQPRIDFIKTEVENRLAVYERKNGIVYKS